MDEEVVNTDFELLEWQKDDGIGDKGSASALNSLNFTHPKDLNFK